MKLNLLKMGKLVVLGAVLTGMTAWQSASAAIIKLEVKVPTVSGWVLVKPGAWPKYGGRVVYDSNLRCYVTDDVTRGETMRITVTPSAGESTAAQATGIGIWCDSKQTYIAWDNVTLPFVNSSYVVPTNPNLDNLYVDVYSNLGFFTVRIPIGPRIK